MNDRPSASDAPESAPRVMRPLICEECRFAPYEGEHETAWPGGRCINCRDGRYRLMRARSENAPPTEPRAHVYGGKCWCGEGEEVVRPPASDDAMPDKTFDYDTVHGIVPAPAVVGSATAAPIGQRSIWMSLGPEGGMFFRPVAGGKSVECRIVSPEEAQEISSLQQRLADATRQRDQFGDQIDSHQAVAKERGAAWIRDREELIVRLAAAERRVGETEKDRDYWKSEAERKHAAMLGAATAFRRVLLGVRNPALTAPLIAQLDEAFANAGFADRAALSSSSDPTGGPK